MKERLLQLILITSFTAVCWLGVQLFHEMGTVLGAKFTGGVVREVTLHPLEISGTFVEPNPDPLFVAWSGIIFGSLAPLIAMFIADIAQLPFRYLWHFFCGFCFVGNGVYVVGGAALYSADPFVIMQHGFPQAGLAGIGVVAVGIGFSLWNNLGVHFGFGSKEDKIEAGAVWTSLVLLALIAGGEVAYSVM